MAKLNPKTNVKNYNKAFRVTTTEENIRMISHLAMSPIKAIICKHHQSW